MEELFYGIDEKYLVAKDELEMSNYAKSKVLLEQVLDEEPAYAKAHYQLGRIQLYELADRERAIYHFELAIKFAPAFTDTYYVYLYLLKIMNRFEAFASLWAKAITLPDACKACLYNMKGTVEEQNGLYNEAIASYKLAIMYALDESDTNDNESAIRRVQAKLHAQKKYVYV